MTRFLVTYHGGKLPSAPVEIERARAQYGAWLDEAGEAILDSGSAVRAVTQLASRAPEPIAAIAGYTMISAGSIEQASALLTSHPFLARGGTLQINEIIE